jgi:hypothetical protein
MAGTESAKSQAVTVFPGMHMRRGGSATARTSLEASVKPAVSKCSRRAPARGGRPDLNPGPRVSQFVHHARRAGIRSPGHKPVFAATVNYAPPVWVEGNLNVTGLPSRTSNMVCGECGVVTMNGGREADGAGGPRSGRFVIGAGGTRTAASARTTAGQQTGSSQGGEDSRENQHPPRWAVEE